MAASLAKVCKTMRDTERIPAQGTPPVNGGDEDGIARMIQECGPSYLQAI
jgi:hypothetical protein